MTALDTLASRLSLGDLLETLRAGWGDYELLAHWTPLPEGACAPSRPTGKAGSASHPI
ncbi:MAG: hypothetical protein VYE22_24055 [Myxococcota bacterium]|nr:hypothetical protein [Myxococcota bacterium]